MRLDHVALTVADPARSAAFYGEHFGLTERVFDDGRLLILAPPGGPELLALSDTEEVPAAAPPRTTHFGFRAQSAAEVRAARARFAAAGIEETEFSEGPPLRVQVNDPDGHRVEVYFYD